MIYTVAYKISEEECSIIDVVIKTRKSEDKTSIVNRKSSMIESTIDNVHLNYNHQNFGLCTFFPHKKLSHFEKLKPLYMT